MNKRDKKDFEKLWFGLKKVYSDTDFITNVFNTPSINKRLKNTTLSKSDLYCIVVDFIEQGMDNDDLLRKYKVSLYKLEALLSSTFSACFYQGSKLTTEKFLTVYMPTEIPEFVLNNDVELYLKERNNYFTLCHEQITGKQDSIKLIRFIEKYYEGTLSLIDFSKFGVDDFLDFYNYYIKVNKYETFSIEDFVKVVKNTNNLPKIAIKKCDSLVGYKYKVDLDDTMEKLTYVSERIEQTEKCLGTLIQEKQQLEKKVSELKEKI